MKRIALLAIATVALYFAACLPVGKVGCDGVTPDEAAYLDQHYAVWYVAATEIPWHPEALTWFFYCVEKDGSVAFSCGPWIQTHNTYLGGCVQWNNPYWQGP